MVEHGAGQHAMLPFQSDGFQAGVDVDTQLLDRIAVLTFLSPASSNLTVVGAFSFCTAISELESLACLFVGVFSNGRCSTGDISFSTHNEPTSVYLSQAFRLNVAQYADTFLSEQRNIL